MVTRGYPNDADGKRDPICPVCMKPILKGDRVSGHGENLMHEACDYTRTRPRAHRRIDVARTDARRRSP